MIPSHSATDDLGWDALTSIQGFRRSSVPHERQLDNTVKAARPAKPVFQRPLSVVQLELQVCILCAPRAEGRRPFWVESVSCTPDRIPVEADGGVRRKV